MKFFKIVIFGYLAVNAIGLLSQLQAQASAGDALAISVLQLAGRLLQTPEVYPLMGVTLLMIWAKNKQ